MQSRQYLINISNLPPQQKKHCTQLLSNHEIVFEQENEQFTARIVIDPSIKKSVPIKVKQPQPKRSITQLINMESFETLIPLLKTVQVYICPKKLSIQKLQNQLEVILEKFFKTNDIDTLIAHNLKGSQSFPQFFFNSLAKTQPNKIKFQQYYVNILQSINHFKGKFKGVKVFQLFVSKTYGLQQMLFFYFLRKMIQTLKTIIIVYKNKLKVSFYGLILEQDHVVTVLQSYLADNYHQIFEQIKKQMKYDAKLKKNIVGAYDLIYILLDNFNKKEENQETRQHFLKSINTSVSREDNYPNEVFEQQQENQIQSRFSFNPQQNLILLGCLEAVKGLCQKIKVSISFYDAFAQLISKLLTYIFSGDKMSWFQQISLEPTNARLVYFQTLQQDYNEYSSKHQDNNLLLNRLIRRTMQAPGLQQFYAKLILSNR